MFTRNLQHSGFLRRILVKWGVYSGFGLGVVDADAKSIIKASYTLK